MKKHLFRRLKSRVEVGSKRRLALTAVLKFFFIIAVTLLLIIGLVYISTYSGYESKLIQNVENFPTEYKETSIILDKYPENDNLLLGFLDRAYEARKITSVKIYALTERDEESIKKIIKKFPLNRVEFKLNINLIPEICKDASTSFDNSKKLIIANPDIAIRTAYICNNLGVLAVPATIEDKEFLTYSTSIRERFDELFKVIFNQF